MSLFNQNPPEDDQNQNQIPPTYANDSRINNPYQRPNEQGNDSYLSQQQINQPFPQNQNPNHYQQPNYQRRLRPNFTRQELENVEIPNQIAKEIRWEKLRVVGLMLLGTFALGVALFFVLVHYLAPIVEETQLKIPLNFIPHPAPMFVLMAGAIIFFLYGMIDYGHLKIDIKVYKGELLMGIEKVPYFLIRNYKSLIARPIYLNWLAFNIYVWGAIVIGIFYIIKAVTKNSPPLNTEIIIMLIILATTLVIHIASLFFTRMRKGNLNAYYGYEIIVFEQVKEIRRHANRVCLTIFFIFLAVVLFVFIIPWLLVRKGRGQKIIPFT